MTSENGQTLLYMLNFLFSKITIILHKDYMPSAIQIAAIIIAS